jgi:D-alanyl-lipoteichoic acid acyltransferase DltB (MBOAT superfamily)
MLFNSIAFLIFLPIVFALYWFVFKRSLKWQNIFVIAASYFFYGWWDWRFLFLLLFSSVMDFSFGLAIGKTENAKRRKWLLLASLIINLGILGFFKYFNFFVDSFIDAFAFTGLQLHSSTLKVILPVGISFYTFQSLSYTIDIYRRNIQPTKSLINYLAFVSFFPQLVAGPIERAKHLLPQFERPRVFSGEEAADGLKLILWGFFKKVAVADTCAVWANSIFNDYQTLSGPTLFLGAIFFTFQIYGDFSGYSDIARGLSKIFGFDLMKNFNLPYFSRSIKEFWSRWHISLSTWFKDYVYIPLGGSRCSKPRQIFNTLVTFTVSGLWHGANWTFVVWGFLNGLFMTPGILLGEKVPGKIAAAGKLLAGPKEAMRIAATFLLTVLAWIFFRSQSLGDAFAFIERMLQGGAVNKTFLRPDALLLIAILLIIEWKQREKDHPLKIDHENVYFRWAGYLFVLLLVLYFGNFRDPQSFIYFQF